ncbi:MAG: phosphatase PAP2 family protein [Saprospiraceae bacterium]|nr:phosphatase PAP2 family protein [Saprospiraceae bacterium]
MKIYFVISLMISSLTVIAQLDTTIVFNNEPPSVLPKSDKFIYKQLIIPTTFLGYGLIGLNNGGIQSLNINIKEEIGKINSTKTNLDDYLQYAPLTSAIALKLLGVRSKQSTRNSIVIFSTAYLIMGVSVNGLKHLTSVERPDKRSFTSFPSGHTATAFMGAELLRKEYGSISPWVGLSGYIVASATGFLRMYNERHWLTDVVAGAGIGILSAKIAYWVYNPIQNFLFPHKKTVVSYSSIIPFYQQGTAGLNIYCYW